MTKPKIRSISRLSREFIRSQTGNVSMMAAGACVLIIGLGSLAIDWGALTLEHRQAQGLADLTAMTAASNLDDHEAVVRAMLADNGHENPIIIVDDPIRYAALTPTGDDASRNAFVPCRDSPPTRQAKYCSIRPDTCGPGHIDNLHPARLRDP